MQDDIVKMPPAHAQPQNPPKKVVHDIVAAQPPEKKSALPQPAQAAPAKPATADQESSSPVAARKKSTLPKGAIAAAVLLCCLLIGLSIFIAMKDSNSQEKISADRPATAQTSPAASTTEEVQAALQQTDSLPDPTDDPEADLSDQSLGL